MRLQTLAVRFFLCFIGTSGSSSQTRFIQTNTDLLLTVTEEVQIGRDIFFWKFQRDNNIARLNENRPFIFPKYDGRVEFFPEDLSLVLKNVQLSDSGIYTAVVSGEQDVIHATHDIRVEAPVSPVLLSVDPVSNSPESCNFTVSCTAELSPSISRSFTCDTNTCEEVHPPTPGPTPSVLTPSLHIYLLTNVSIICNHSNHVSWRNDTEEIQQVCSSTEEPDDEGTADTGAIVGVIVLILCLIGLVVGVVVLRKRQKCQRINMENTVYEAPETVAPRPAGRDIVSTESPSSIYSTVQPHTGPAPAPAQNPESLYATVNKTSTPDLLSSV